jgi:hypothetical protein
MKMKSQSFVLILLLSSYLAVELKNGSSPSKITKKERKLTSSDLLNNRLIEHQRALSVEKIREEIIDMHKNVKLCIDEEFEKEPNEILPFDDILKMCVGENYAIILRFYKEVIFEIKEITKEKIKSKLKDGFCDNILFMCIEYFKALEIFMDKDFEIIHSLELSRKNLERRIDRDKLDYLEKLTEDEVHDYDTIRADLLDERRFLTEYFKEQFELYEHKHAGVNFIQDDQLIDEENDIDGEHGETGDPLEEVNEEVLNEDDLNNE